MDACQKLLTRAPRMAGWVLACCAASAAGQERSSAIRLPAWVASGASASIQPSGFELAPRPPVPQLVKPRELLGPFSEAVPLTEAANEPEAEVSLYRQLRQLEHAASEASTGHALSRLITRCERVRQAAVQASETTTAKRADRIASWAHEARGRQRTAEGRHVAAISDFNLALRLEVGNLSARHALAIILAQTDRADQALVELSEVLAKSPRSHAVLRDRARVHLTLGSVESAIADCDTALKLISADHPDRAATLRLRGVALHAAGRLREAASDLNASLRIAPDQADVLTARGHVFAEGEFFHQAAADYNSAVHADPSNAEAYRALAWLLATCPDPQLRNADTAVEAAWRARRLGSVDDFLTLEASAAAAAAAGDFATAIRLQEQAVMAVSESASAAAQQRLRTYKSGRPYLASRRAESR